MVNLLRDEAEISVDGIGLHLQQNQLEWLSEFRLDHQ